MAEATFVHDGDAVDYTPAADVAAGEVVVQDTLVGVAKVPIPAGTLGALAVRGVFDVAKDGATVFSAGQLVYWDDTSDLAVDTRHDRHRQGGRRRRKRSDLGTDADHAGLRGRQRERRPRLIAPP